MGDDANGRRTSGPEIRLDRLEAHLEESFRELDRAMTMSTFLVLEAIKALSEHLKQPG